MSGEVTGVWTTGTHVVVEGPITVPSNGSLTIEQNVTISFETSSPVIVNGGFLASGTDQYPVVLQPLVPNWGGFQFNSYPDPRSLSWLHVDTSYAMPLRVLVSNSSDLEIRSCVFFALRSGLEAYGGLVDMRESFLMSRARFSKTVILEGLASDPLRRQPCSVDAHSSRLADNILIARAEYDPQIRSYPRDAYTSALVVERSTNLCISGNTFTVEAPWTCIGVHFGELPDEGDPVWFLNFGTIAVRSFDGMPLGINKANDGYLLALRCNIDVGKINSDNYYTSTGVRASHNAQIVLNSSALLLDQGDNFFMSVSGGLLTVDYNTHWTTGSAGPNGGAGDRGDDVADTDDLNDGIIYGLHNIHANPLFVMDGPWGRWTTKSDVRRYYSLQSGSPCIDAGDTLYGRDNDGTLPDIGHFPFDGLAVGDPRDQSRLPMALEVGSAYPNPFNMSTTVPFELNHAGLVTISVSDVLGREVVTQVIGPLATGKHEVVWDAAGASSGTYFLTVGLNGVRMSSQQVYLLK